MRSFLLSLCLLLSSSSLFALDYYWVGGSGTWSDYANHWATTSGGTTFHTQVPTNLDDVYFDQNSGLTASSTISADQTIIYCKSMIWTGITTYPTFQTSLISNTLKIFGSLTLCPQINFAFNGNLNFEATTPGNTITSSGLTLKAYYINFNGVNGTWTLQDKFTALYRIIHSAGIIYSNNQTLEISSFETQGNISAGLVLGTSLVKFSPTASWSITNTNYNLQAQDATLLFSAPYQSSATFNSIPFNYNKIITINFSISFYCLNCNVDSLQLGADANLAGNSNFQFISLSPGYTYQITGNLKINDNGEIVANGTCATPIYLLPGSRTSSYTLEKNTGIVDVSYVYLQNSSTVGTATFNANNSFTLGTVTGWNISAPTPKTLYWIGNTGNWSNSANWTDSPTGTSGVGCIPTYVDDVYFDPYMNVGSISVRIDSKISYCHNMDWSACDNNSPGSVGLSMTSPAAIKTLYITGSLRLSSPISNTSANICFNSLQPGNTITTDGVSISGNVTFDGIGGGWSLTDKLTANYLYFYNGSFTTNGENIDIYYNVNINADSPNSVELFLNNSTITIWALTKTDVWNCSATPIKLQSGTSTIITKPSSTGQSYFNGGNNHYYNIISNTSNLAVTLESAHKLVLTYHGALQNSQIYDSLVFSAGYTYRLYGSTTTINDAFVASGSCSAFITITGNSGAGSSIYKTSGTVTCDRLRISYCNGTGGATFLANNSMDLGSVNGWVISAYIPRSLYWVGGGGNWNDIMHWSLSSGGIGGECIPGILDNVTMDASSGLSNGTISSAGGNCNHFDASALVASATLNLGSLNVYGSFIWSAYATGNVTLNLKGSGIEIVEHYNLILNALNITGSGQWTISDPLTVTTKITHSGGKFITAGNPIVVYQGYDGSSASNATLDLRNSYLTIQEGAFFGLPHGFTLLGTNSTIEFLNQSPGPNMAGINFSSTMSMSEPSGWGLSFGRVICRNNAARFRVASGQHSFQYLLAEGGAIVTNACTFDTLALTPGRTYTFPSGMTQKINAYIDAIGLPGFPIEILASSVGVACTINKTSGTVCAEYLYLRDVHATGGASFYAGNNGANVSNNTGWTFSSCATTTATTNPVDFEISIYPVPVSSTLNYSINGSENYSVKIVDILNKEVYTETNVSGNTQKVIDATMLTPGIYFLIIEEYGVAERFVVSK